MDAIQLSFSESSQWLLRIILAPLMFGVFDGLGGMAVVAMLWGIWHIIAGSLLASIWGYRSSKLAHSLSLGSEAVTS